MARPMSYDNDNDLEIACEKYFRDCMHDSDDKLLPWKEWQPFTVSGLALSLGVCRKTLNNYKKKPEFLHTIKKAFLQIENYLEMRLFGKTVTGVIFNLKNNFGWKDKIEQGIDITVKNREFTLNFNNFNIDDKPKTDES